MQLKNVAAWIPEEKAQLEVKKAPFPDCGNDELVIENRAVAVNPIDWKIQRGGGFGLKYPAILGEDVAGTIIEVGKSLVHKYKPGQRVIAHALGLGRGPAYGGFQLYVRARHEVVSIIPDAISFEDAVVLPLSVSTAAAGLYLKATLGLAYPRLPKHHSKSNISTKAGNEAINFDHPYHLDLDLEVGPDLDFDPSRTTFRPQWLLLWGGSSSVGSSVIQLAKASGYNIITTASPANFSYCEILGANLVVDYHSASVIDTIVSILRDEDVVGAYDAIGSEITVKQSASILSALGGGRVVSVVSAPGGLPDNVDVVRIGSGNIVSQEPEVAKKVWGDFLPKALESGTLVPAPKPLVVGEGLDSVQAGLDRQRQGVSARKVVVEL